MKKRVICMLLSVLITLSLAACGKEPDSAAAFSVTEETIRAALEKTDLPEVLCPEETETLGDLTTYVLRDPAHKEDPSAKTFVSGASTDTGRVLYVQVLGASLEERPTFSWGDWQGYFQLASALFGGLEEDALYNAFAAQTWEDGEETNISQHLTESARWTAEVPGGYCVAVYQLANTQTVYAGTSAGGTRVLAYAPRLYLTVYESKAQYEGLKGA